MHEHRDDGTFRSFFSPRSSFLLTDGFLRFKNCISQQVLVRLFPSAMASSISNIRLAWYHILPLFFSVFFCVVCVVLFFRPVLVSLCILSFLETGAVGRDSLLISKRLEICCRGIAISSAIESTFPTFPFFWWRQVVLFPFNRRSLSWLL